MAEARIPVDLFNPGQVFACLGFMEAAEILLGQAEGGFDWSDETDVRFVLRAAGEADPVREVLGFLAKAQVAAVLSATRVFDMTKWGKPETKKRPAKPFSIDEWKKSWKIQTRAIPEPVFPFPLPDGPDVLPAILEAKDGCLPVEHWGDATRRDSVKFWAGMAGYPGAALLRDAMDLCRQRLRSEPAAVAADPFGLACEQSSGFRLDWRRDYIALDIGFSANQHGHIGMRGHPLVEVLAVVGLQNARPKRLKQLEYRYGVAKEMLPPMLSRAALGAVDLPFAIRRFRMRLGWPGQEGQARCILDVVEEK